MGQSLGRVIRVGEHQVSIRSVLKDDGTHGTSYFLARDTATDEMYLLSRFVSSDSEALEQAVAVHEMWEKLEPKANIMKYVDGEERDVDNESNVSSGTPNEKKGRSGSRTSRSSSRASNTAVQVQLGVGKLREVLILTEYCSGGSLADWIERHSGSHKPVRQMHLLDLFRQAVLGVCYLHAQIPPIAHRDIQPRSFGMSGTTCKLGYFHNAVKRYTRSTTDSLVDGGNAGDKPRFWPPEMLDPSLKLHISEKVDIFSLGCLLFEMAYFKPPFPDSNVLGALGGNIDFPSASQTPYDESINVLIKAMLSADPADRPDSFAVLRRINKLMGRGVDEGMMKSKLGRGDGSVNDIGGNLSRSGSVTGMEVSRHMSAKAAAEAAGSGTERSYRSNSMPDFPHLDISSGVEEGAEAHKKKDKDKDGEWGEWGDNDDAEKDQRAPAVSRSSRTDSNPTPLLPPPPSGPTKPTLYSPTRSTSVSSGLAQLSMPKPTSENQSSSSDHLRRRRVHSRSKPLQMGQGQDDDSINTNANLGSRSSSISGSDSFESSGPPIADLPIERASSAVPLRSGMSVNLMDFDFSPTAPTTSAAPPSTSAIASTQQQHQQPQPQLFKIGDGGDSFFDDFNPRAPQQPQPTKAPVHSTSSIFDNANPTLNINTNADQSLDFDFDFGASTASANNVNVNVSANVNLDAARTLFPSQAQPPPSMAMNMPINRGPYGRLRGYCTVCELGTCAQFVRSNTLNCSACGHPAEQHIAL